MIRFVLNCYILLLIVDAILSYFPKYGLYPAVQKLRHLANLSCRPIRKYLPKDLPFDVSPLVVIILIRLAFVLW